MSIQQWIGRLFGRSPDEVQASGQNVSGITPGTPAYEWLTGGAHGGATLSESKAMGQATVYACVSLIGGAIALMPLHVYRRTEDGRERHNSDLWWLLNEQMNPRWGAAVGWEFGVQSLLLHGDMFLRIDRASAYSPVIVGFTPMHPQQVMVDTVGDRLVYLYSDDGKIKAYDQDDVLHIPGPGFDGKRGMSQIQYVLRQPVNIAIDAGNQAASMLGEGLRPDLALVAPRETKLGQEQIDMLRMQWASRYSGIANSKAPVVVSGGMDIKELSMTSADAQLLETRGMQVDQIAQVFGVPPHMIGRTEKTTSWGSGVEQMSIGFVKYTLQRHLVKIEQEINRKCFKTSRHFCEFDTKGLERGDIKTRNESYRIALGRAGEPGWMSINEVRRAENLPPVEGGDELMKPDAKQEEKHEQTNATSDSQ